MKSFLLLVLSFLLSMAILAPSVITLVGDGDTVFVMDFNEEENKKEEKKELSEKDFLFYLDFLELTATHTQKDFFSSFYQEGDYAFEVDIFLRPPEPLL